MGKNKTSFKLYLTELKVFIKPLLFTFIGWIVFYPVNAGPDTIANQAKVTAA